MSGKIVIIDGNSLINRAFYAMQRPMITKEGIYTQGIYGFINMLNKIMGDYEPEYMAVAFDLKAPTFRHLEYAEYKAGRKAMPPELAMQMPLMKDILRAMNIEILELEGFEADDIIGTVARMGEEQGIDPLIVTGDKDALQLATEKTHVLITKKGVTDFELFDHDKMIERYNLTPTQFIDLKGLMGDSSDNIPGIPGVGEKTGIALLEQFGSVENLIENTDQISKAGLRKKVEENVQLAILSKRLATINRFVPLDIQFDKFKVEEPDYNKLIELYQKLEFNSFLKRLKVEEPEPEMEPAVSAVVEKRALRTRSDLEALKSLSGKEVYLKVFGDYGHVNRPEIHGIFFMSDDKAFFADCVSVSPAEITEVLNESKLSFTGHDLKDDLYSLMCYGLTNYDICFDTAIAEYVLDVARSKYELKTLALEKLHKVLPEQSDFMAGAGQLDMFADTSNSYLDYGAVLGSTVFAVKNVQKAAISDNNLEKILYEVELPLIEVMAAMEVEGVRTNKAFLDEFGADLKEKIDLLELKIYDLAGTKFNINSPAQLGEILFETLQLPSGKKTKRGYSTSADILEKIKDNHPVVPAVLEYRNLTKLNSTYVEGMKPLISSESKIHAHFQQTVTATGRISCTEPNLQNIPIRQELGRNLRRAFEAEEGYTLVGADYSQIELRVLAHLSQDQSLIDAFNNGEDIHKMTASRVLGIPADQVTVGDRSRAKAVNFGVIYGMSGFGLSEELNITRKEAENYIAEYFRKHEKVKEYMDGQIASARETGYSETILGRKRAIHEINASAYMVRQLGERLAMNSPIQGSAADIIKVAMIKVYRELREKHPDSKLILQVHDELIIQAKNDELEEIKELLVRNMESAMNLSVKLLAEVNTGSTWYDLK
ncbi:MAG: DNA polymerase I [Firmicutes bacterium]|nr:DNA polymerase I [Bacillota bacterium]